MLVSVIAFTHTGALLCRRLTESLGSCAGISAKGFAKERLPGLEGIETDLKSFARRRFEESNALVFIGAAGIAVRAVAPLLKSKAIDPAVIVIDELGKHVIPILSGHIGGANRLARQLAQLLGAEAVLTTATDIEGVFAADEWAVLNHCAVYNPEVIKFISSALLAGNEVGFCSDFPVEGELPLNVGNPAAQAGICVTLDTSKRPFCQTLTLVPRCVTVGIGCRRGTAAEVLEKRLLDTLEQNGLLVCALESVATIDQKADEEGLHAVCKKYGLRLQTFSADELGAVEGIFQTSDFVRQTVGVDNVCERAAVKTGGRLIIHKTCGDGVTVAAAQAEWRGSFEHYSSMHGSSYGKP